MRGASLGRSPVLSLVENRIELVVFLLRDRVEFVCVTLRTADSEAHEDLTGRIGAILDGDDAEFLIDGSAERVRQRVAVKGSGEHLFGTRVWKQVSSELLDGEAVVGKVAVEGLDHPIAVTPNRAQRVATIPARVGVAGEVEPHPRPAFAEGRGGEQAIDELLVGCRARIAGEGVGLFWCWRQAY